MLEYRDIEINAFPFYFFVNCLREVRNMSKLISYFSISCKFVSYIFESAPKSRLNRFCTFMGLNYPLNLVNRKAIGQSAL